MDGIPITKVFQDDDVSTYRLTGRILAHLKGVPVYPASALASGAPSMDTTSGKTALYLQKYRGDFLKPCPGTRTYICCGYQILNLAANCPLDCSYCILQSYFADQPCLRVFVNLDRYGNTSAATIPTTLDEAIRDGRIKKGHTVLMDAFGAGLTYGALLMRW